MDDSNNGVVLYDKDTQTPLGFITLEQLSALVESASTNETTA